ncbi:hypothetical protein GB880_007015 [Paracoccus sp. SMMA_5_TC]|uniref:hypothetical protein n=1 Tax=Paracoccus sp. SMMA_5_TC TaxID=2654280 RepID=UPI0013556D4D|nr:hypothetical protein [Paracoccus sp. SMMA_5_TC]UXU79587.1 hypothetical protein GB880_007015 [Paracoccus sp. SMMA_5_TC]
MPRHEAVVLEYGQWVQLTVADVTAISFQVIAGAEVHITGTDGPVPPGPGAAGWQYAPGQGERNVALADLFPGIAASRVWAQASGGGGVPGRVMVSHA